MKMNVPIQKTILVALLSFMLLSCATTRSGMQQVQLGMSKQEVENKVGRHFQVVSMTQTDQGGLEVLRYNDDVAENSGVVTKGYYILHFLNGKLVELNYEDIRSHQHPPRPGRPR